MAKGNLPAVLAETLAHEGGYSSNPKDPGNWTGGKVGAGKLLGTQKGIAAASYPNRDIRNLTDADIQAIYQHDFWHPVRGDDLPSGVDLSVFDAGVMSGPSRSAKWLQQVVGAKADGVVGTATLAALKSIAPRAVIKGHCAKRLGFVQSLAIWNTFGKGWSRRIASVEATALSWVSSKAQLEADTQAARSASNRQAGSVVTTGAAGAVDQANHLSGLPVGVVIAVFAIVAAVLVIRIVINNQRASALAKAAKEA
ncbi:glycoside hydrolase family 108 protein [Paradevosia shaoguanensis]|uniref:glycoside hydrolase family 108 protein n=1 Tax=Paradevosia shaoguanensis TaxID=1335043 RepID=UPI003C76471B